MPHHLPLLSIMAVVLSVAPHPDDEVIAGGPVCIDLLAAGHDVHALLVSLGRPEQHQRRHDEARAAATVGGWSLHAPDATAAIGAHDDPALAQSLVASQVRDLARELGADLVIAPSPHDAHHGHEVVGRAVTEALRGEDGVRWWAWALWGHLPRTTLIHAFDEGTMRVAVTALEAYRGELERNDYRRLLVGGSEAAAVLGPERVFGFGSGRVSDLPYASLFLELEARAGDWEACTPGILDVTSPLAGRSPTGHVAGWLDEPSPYS
jgi:GlcNAc-PI de-N-acetylase